MARERKTVDRWDIETNYGYGWKEAKQHYKEYLENIRGAVRLVKHREPKEV